MPTAPAIGLWERWRLFLRSRQARINQARVIEELGAEPLHPDLAQFVPPPANGRRKLAR